MLYRDNEEIAASTFRKNFLDAIDKKSYNPCHSPPGPTGGAFPVTGRRGSMGGGAVPASVARSPSPRALCATQRRLGMGP